MRLAACLSAVLALLAATAHPARAGAVLDRVRAAGTLSCGVLTEPADYTHDDAHGPMADFGADLCRAVAAATLDGAEHVRLVSLPDEADGFDALAAGRIDVLMGAGASLATSLAHGVTFAHPVFLDGVGILAPLSIRSLEGLAGKTLCFIPSQPGHEALIAGLVRRDIKIAPFPFEELGEMEAAFVGGRCDAMAGPLTQLAESRSAFGGARHRFALLPDRLTLDPVAPATRADDPAWSRIVDYAVSALIEADADGVTRANLAEMRASAAPAVRRLLGLDPVVGRLLGLPDDFAARAITAVGGYAEVYERDLGAHSDLDLARGPNAAWTGGGALLAAPFR